METFLKLYTIAHLKAVKLKNEEASFAIIYAKVRKCLKCLKLKSSLFKKNDHLGPVPPN